MDVTYLLTVVIGENAVHGWVSLFDLVAVKKNTLYTILYCNLHTARL
jgi:hypothetical protein